MNTLIIGCNGMARLGDKSFRCAVGRNGISRAKREGDGTTPVGGWTLRSVLYRADRIAKPDTSLEAWPISPNDGWCDDPEDRAYNKPVRLPYNAGTEMLWREDAIYNLIVPLGYNDNPAIPELGSAIFLHIARLDYAGTRGCIALQEDDLRTFLRNADAASRVVVLP